MIKDTSRHEFEQQVSIIRETYRILLNEESRDAITEGLLSNIGVLIDEVDYWRAEYLRLKSLQDNHCIQATQRNQTENIVIREEDIRYECPNCTAGFECNEQTGLSWDSIGQMENERGYTIDIGYIHCSECGKDSPLYAGKEIAIMSWCIEIVDNYN
jgi:hypothetical protein